MNLLKLCCLLALAVTAVAADGSKSTASSMSEDVEAPITKEALEEIITELKAAAASDPTFTAILNGINLDDLLTLTPDEARAKLNSLIFEATPAPTSSNSTSSNSTETKDVASPATTSSPAPQATTAPSSAANGFVSTTAAIAVASVVTYVVY